MARAARHKSTEAAFYHLTNRVAGRTDWFPLEDHQARSKLDMMLFYVNAYRCRLAAFQIMGNHFHFIVHFETSALVPRGVEGERPQTLWATGRGENRLWTDAQWEAFNQLLKTVPF